MSYYVPNRAMHKVCCEVVMSLVAKVALFIRQVFKCYLNIKVIFRTKRTHEEARRLGQIEEELKKLDVKLSNDVSILRNQIELASLEFMESQ